MQRCDISTALDPGEADRGRLGVPDRHASHMMRRPGRASSRHRCRSTRRKHLARGLSLRLLTCRRHFWFMRTSPSAKARCGTRRGFILGFVVPYVSISRAGPQSRRWRCQGDLALVRRSRAARPWWYDTRGGWRAKNHRAGCRPRSRRSPRSAVGVRDLARRRTMRWTLDVQTWSVHVSGWNADTARALRRSPEIVAVPDAPSTARRSLFGGWHPGIRENQDGPGSQARPPCARRPSSAAMQAL